LPSGLSHAAESRFIKLGISALGHDPGVDKGRDDDLHGARRWKPWNHSDACHAAVSIGLAASARFVCLGLEGEPYRTAGNEGVPLQ
jgi:hypothetical protein